MLAGAISWRFKSSRPHHSQVDALLCRLKRLRQRDDADCVGNIIKRESLSSRIHDETLLRNEIGARRMKSALDPRCRTAFDLNGPQLSTRERKDQINLGIYAIIEPPSIYARPCLQPRIARMNLNRPDGMYGVALPIFLLQPISDIGSILIQGELRDSGWRARRDTHDPTSDVWHAEAGGCVSVDRASGPLPDYRSGPQGAG